MPNICHPDLLLFKASGLETGALEGATFAVGSARIGADTPCLKTWARALRAAFSRGHRQSAQPRDTTEAAEPRGEARSGGNRPPDSIGRASVYRGIAASRPALFRQRGW